jgi:hypothetical protein
MAPIHITVTVVQDPVILDENVTEISQQLRTKIDRIILKAKEAADLTRSITNAKTAKKNLELRKMESVLLVLLETPQGVGRGEILIAADDMDFVPVINKFRAYLRKNNTYTLKKRLVNKQPIYFVDPVR